MKILVGITSKNRVQVLPKAINSALAQDYPNKEVWVFDDASSDGTKELKEQFPQVNWIISETPKGLVYARNLFMQKNEFDLFCSLDDDAWFTENDTLSRSVKYIKNHPDTGAIAYTILSTDKPNITHNKKNQLVNTFIGCGHLIVNKAAEKAGYYIPNPGFYGCEEKDLCIRLLECGYNIVKLKEHVWHDKTIISRNFSAQHRSGVCNDLIFMLRRTPIYLLAPSLLFKIYKHLRFSRKNNLLKPCFEGISDFWKFVITQKIQREAVSFNTFCKFLKYNSSPT